MGTAALLTLLVSALGDAPEIVKDVKDVIAAFEGGGPAAAKSLIAVRFASETAALAQQLQTPIQGAK